MSANPNRADVVARVHSFSELPLQQRLQFSENFIHRLARELAYSRGPTCVPVEASNLIREHCTADG